MATAASSIDAALTRDDVVEAVLTLCLRYFRRIVFFIVREPWVLGWSGTVRGDGPFARRVPSHSPRRAVGLPDRFPRQDTLHRPLSPRGREPALPEGAGKRPSTNAAILPVALRGRVVNLIYGDNGAGGQVKPDLGELIVLAPEDPARVPPHHRASASPRPRRPRRTNRPRIPCMIERMKEIRRRRKRKEKALKSRKRAAIAAAKKSTKK